MKVSSQLQPWGDILGDAGDTFTSWILKTILTTNLVAQQQSGCRLMNMHSSLFAVAPVV